VIGLDANVLARYLVQDDPDQSLRATRLIHSLTETNQAFVSVVTLVELHWVLRRAYKVARDDAAVVVRKLLDARELELQEPDAVRRALTRLADDVDFSDALISELGAGAGCAYTATFDGRATRLAGMELVPRIDGSETA
jgi:predicted nucleic-acid-binding protein